jgi:hypothetical protein
MAAAWLPAAASAEEEPPPDAGLLIPFELKASNGYEILGLAGSPGLGRPGALLLMVTGKHGSATYSVPAQVDRDSVSADLGALGSIDLEVVETGGKRTYRSSCGDKHPIEIPNLEYRGTISFRGEGGYTRADVDSAKAEPQFVLDLVCGASGGEAGGGSLPGAKLTTRTTKTANHQAARFEAVTNGPGKPVLLSATVWERRGSVKISRSVSDQVGASAFEYDQHLKSATLDPPSPFHGSAVFSRNSGAASWKGDLTVDFPGRPGVHLAGPGFDTGLIHASYSSPKGTVFRLSP